MRSRYLFPLIAFGLIATMAIYFIINPSYQKSIEAKYYFEVGKYKEAYELANEAFSMDVYNRMASTIMAQSTTSLKYVKYIEQAQAFLQQINEIATHENISTSDRARMKIMSEIMLDSYVKLAPSIITDEALVKKAKKYRNDFEHLLEKVTQ